LEIGDKKISCPNCNETHVYICQECSGLGVFNGDNFACFACGVAIDPKNHRISDGKFCQECFDKHLAQAYVVSLEYLKDPTALARIKIIGHLAEAEDEGEQKFKGVIRSIRRNFQTSGDIDPKSILEVNNV
jgi:hypothetical protein